MVRFLGVLTYTLKLRLDPVGTARGSDTAVLTRAYRGVPARVSPRRVLVRASPTINRHSVNSSEKAREISLAGFL